MVIGLFLDDIRDPLETEGVAWRVVRSAQAFRAWIETIGLPDRISFDHDLGEESDGSGMDCAKWLVEYCLDHDVTLPEWTVHSANPPGAANIQGLLISFENRGT